MNQVSLEGQYTPLKACEPESASSDSTRRASYVRPFLRWAGGKQWLAAALATNIRQSSGRYVEPFVGGGAVFFRANPAHAVLGDKNPALIEAFRCVRDEPEELIHFMRSWSADEATYYRVRSARYSVPAQRAAQFLYLNRTCWNGLYRVNRRGEFNVPYGKPSRHDPLEAASVVAASASLKKTQLVAGPFEQSMSLAEPGDFVYCDPPYTLQHANNGFTKYNEVLFGWSDQLRLAQVAHDLVKRRCIVVISNAWHDSLRDIYSGFFAYRLSRRSTIGGRGSRRGQTAEALYSSVPLVGLESLQHEEAHT